MLNIHLKTGIFCRPAVCFIHCIKIYIEVVERFQVKNSRLSDHFYHCHWGSSAYHWGWDQRTEDHHFKLSSEPLCTCLYLGYVKSTVAHLTAKSLHICVKIVFNSEGQIFYLSSRCYNGLGSNPQPKSPVNKHQTCKPLCLLLKTLEKLGMTQKQLTEAQGWPFINVLEVL